MQAAAALGKEGARGGAGAPPRAGRVESVGRGARTLRVPRTMRAAAACGGSAACGVSGRAAPTPPLPRWRDGGAVAARRGGVAPRACPVVGVCVTGEPRAASTMAPGCACRRWAPGRVLKSANQAPMMAREWRGMMRSSAAASVGHVGEQRTHWLVAAQLDGSIGTCERSGPWASTNCTWDSFAFAPQRALHPDDVLLQCANNFLVIFQKEVERSGHGTQTPSCYDRALSSLNLENSSLRCRLASGVSHQRTDRASR